MFGSPTMVMARPKTRPWNRRTNAAEPSGSLEARPASSDSSESDLTETHTAQRLGWIARRPPSPASEAKGATHRPLMIRDASCADQKKEASNGPQGNARLADRPITRLR